MKPLKTIPHGLQNYVLQLPDEEWLEEARCAYRTRPKVFMGKDTTDMSEEDFLKLIDKTFLADHEDRWSSGSESAGLHAAVQECLKCPAIEGCLRWACENDSSLAYGIYGGTTPWERRAVMKEDGLFPDLTFEERLKVLLRLVRAKQAGLVPTSVRLDLLRTEIRKLASDPEGWDKLLEEKLEEKEAEQDAESPAEGGCCGNCERQS